MYLYLLQMSLKNCSNSKKLYKIKFNAYHFLFLIQELASLLRGSRVVFFKRENIFNLLLLLRNQNLVILILFNNKKLCSTA